MYLPFKADDLSILLNMVENLFPSNTGFVSEHIEKSNPKLLALLKYIINKELTPLVQGQKEISLDGYINLYCCLVTTLSLLIHKELLEKVSREVGEQQ